MQWGLSKDNRNDEEVGKLGISGPIPLAVD